MDDRTYRRMTSESQRERINRLNGHIVASCLGCGVGFTSQRNAKGHTYDKMPRWRFEFRREPVRKKPGYKVHEGTYECNAVNEAIAGSHFWARHRSKHSGYLITKTERIR